MKKAIIAIVAVLIVAGGGAGYYLLTKQDETKNQTNSTTNNDQQSNNSNDSNSPDIAAVLDAVKSKYSTVKETKVFTEENDPNNTLGKEGSYVSGGAFWDTRTEYSDEYDDDKARWGTDAGGAIEVFANKEDATKRVGLLEATQGSFLDAGAVKQIDNIVLRASSKYPKSLQDEMIAFLEEQIK